MDESSSTGAREYGYTRLTMLNAINDLIELQKGKVTFDDISKGQIYFIIEMYGFIWENRFTVEDADGGKSRVTLCIEGDALNRIDKISGQFALLDSILVNIPGARSRHEYSTALQQHTHEEIPEDSSERGDTMSINYCPKCGGENDAAATYCGFCREPLTLATAAVAGAEPLSQTAAPEPAPQVAPEPQSAPPAPTAAAPIPTQQPAPQPTEQFQQQPTQQFPPPQPQPTAQFQPPPPQAQPVQPTQQMPQAHPAEPVQGTYQPPQNYSPDGAPPKKKSKLKFIIIGIIAFMLIVAGITIVVVLNTVSDITNEVAEAAYFEIDADQVPSVKTALNKKFEVTGYYHNTSAEMETLEIAFKTDGASNEDMRAYAQYLADQGWVRTQDIDWTQTSNPKSAQKGFQMAKNSTVSGYVVVVTIYYEPGTFNLVIDRLEGDVSVTSSDLGGPDSADVSDPSSGLSSGISSGTSSGTAGPPNEANLLAPAYFRTLNSGHYFMEMTLYLYPTSGGTPEETSMELYVDGSDEAMITNTLGQSVRLLYKDGKRYMIIDSEQMVYEGLEGTDSLAPDASNMTYVRTTEDNFRGQTLYCEIWKSSDGSETKWFFDLDAGWIEGFSSVNEFGQLQEVYIARLLTNYDSSAFDIPSNYQVAQL